MPANFSSAIGFSASSIWARERVLSSSSSSACGLARRSTMSSSSSDEAASSSSGSSSSLKAGPATAALISPSPSPPPSSLSLICSAVGPLDSIASRSRISRSCIVPSLRAFDHSMMALKVIGLSHRPQIIVSRPASMRLAMAISPSRDSSSTAPISRRYMRTGSSVRSTASFLVATAGRGLPSSRGSTSSSGSFFLFLVVRIAVLDDVDAHLADRGHDVLDLLAVHLVLRQRLVELIIGDDALLLRAGDQFLDRASLRSISGASPVSVSVSGVSFFAIGSAAYSLPARDASLSL